MLQDSREGDYQTCKITLGKRAIRIAALTSNGVSYHVSEYAAAELREFTLGRLLRTTGFHD